MKNLVITLYGIWITFCSFIAIFFVNILPDIQDMSPFTILLLALSILCWFINGFLFYNFANTYNGCVWGIKIISTTKNKLTMLVSCFGLLPCLFLGVNVFIDKLGIVISSIFGGKLIIGIIMLVLCALDIGAVYLGAYLSMNKTKKIIATQSNALHIGELDVFKAIDENINQATYFVVSFEGVALFTNTNYCYAVYPYTDYRLGDLSSPEEVAMIGMYFVQKYHKEFDFKIDMEVIPGEPGQTAVAVGTGGIAIARTAGTKDQRIFRSYIFTRK